MVWGWYDESFVGRYPPLADGKGADKRGAGAVGSTNFGGWEEEDGLGNEFAAGLAFSLLYGVNVKKRLL
jgi:hypothetical protein